MERDKQKKFSIKPIISHEKRFIYLHIPKNASSTIRDCLFGRQKELDYIFYKNVNSYNDYFKFAFFRNPYDRFLSFYKDNLKGDVLNQEEYRPYGQYSKLENIDNLINHVITYDDFELDYHLKPQSWFVDGIDLDFVGNIENFDNDMIKVRWLIGAHKPHKHLRQTSDKYTLNNEQKKLIYDRYKIDFERFGYEK